MSLKELRNRIQSVKSTQKITAAMKMVASAKLKRVQDKVMHGREYLHSLNLMGGYIGRALQDSENSNPWMQTNGTHDLIIVFGATKGLCGSFHSNLQRHALQTTEEFKNAKILVIGRKLKEIFAKKYQNRFLNFELNDRLISLETFLALALYLENEKKVGNLNHIYLVGSHFKNVLIQEFNTKNLCSFDFPVSCDTTIFEPSVDVFLPIFFKHYVATCLYQSWLETGAGEVASRMTAMDNATRNASDMISNLSLRYNRTRQAKITTELIEIISGYQSVNG